MFPISAGLGALSCLTSLLKSSTSSSATQGGNALSQLGSIIGDKDGDKDKKSSAALGTGGTAQPFSTDTWSSLLAATTTSSDSASGSGGTTTGQNGLIDQLIKLQSLLKPSTSTTSTSA